MYTTGSTATENTRDQASRLEATELNGAKFFFFLKNILSSKLGWWEDDRGRSKGDQKAIGERSKANRRCSEGDQKKQKNRTIIFDTLSTLDEHNGTRRKTKLAGGRNTRGRRSLRDHNRACGRNFGKKNSQKRERDQGLRNLRMLRRDCRNA